MSEAAVATVYQMPRRRTRQRQNPALAYGATSRPGPEDATTIELQALMFPSRGLGEQPLDRDKVRLIREQMKLSQTQFGQLLNVSTVTVSRWERGVAVPTPWLSEALTAFGALLDHHTVGDTVRRALVFRGALSTFQELLAFVYVR